MPNRDQGAQSLEFQGLGTLTYVIPVAGTYSVESKSSTPTATSGGTPSGLVTTINKNGSPVTGGTSDAGSMGSTARGIACVVGDSITVVYTSAVAADALLNVIKSQVQISQGS